jgi:hypothetical protein
LQPAWRATSWAGLSDESTGVRKMLTIAADEFAPSVIFLVRAGREA